jgi:hypothetical protein
MMITNKNAKLFPSELLLLYDLATATGHAAPKHMGIIASNTLACITYASFLVTDQSHFMIGQCFTACYSSELDKYLQMALMMH